MAVTNNSPLILSRFEFPPDAEGKLWGVAPHGVVSGGFNTVGDATGGSMITNLTFPATQQHQVIFRFDKVTLRHTSVDGSGGVTLSLLGGLWPELVGDQVDVHAEGAMTQPGSVEITGPFWYKARRARTATTIWRWSEANVNSRQTMLWCQGVYWDVTDLRRLKAQLRTL